jgi:hypothetical protein
MPFSVCIRAEKEYTDWLDWCSRQSGINEYFLNHKFRTFMERIRHGHMLKQYQKVTGLSV